MLNPCSWWKWRWRHILLTGKCKSRHVLPLRVQFELLSAIGRCDWQRRTSSAVNPVVLHDVAAHECAGAAEARLAVHGKRACLALRQLQELLQDGIGGAGAVWKVEVHKVEASLHERPLLVLLHQAHACWSATYLAIADLCSKSEVYQRTVNHMQDLRSTCVAAHSYTQHYFAHLGCSTSLCLI